VADRLHSEGDPEFWELGRLNGMTVLTPLVNGEIVVVSHWAPNARAGK
jgi:hypothetical protein